MLVDSKLRITKYKNLQIFKFEGFLLLEFYLVFKILVLYLVYNDLSGAGILA
jgi:hypothetical protein